MPQMMPINWIMSLIFFILIFILFNIMNYFIFEIKPPMKNKFNLINKPLCKNNWKW